jgi:hypothetical protein
MRALSGSLERVWGEISKRQKREREEEEAIHFEWQKESIKVVYGEWDKKEKINICFFCDIVVRMNQCGR